MNTQSVQPALRTEAGWREVAADPDPAVAARAWTDLGAPRACLSGPIRRDVVDWLAATGTGIWSFLSNDAIPIAQRCRVLEQASHKDAARYIEMRLLSVPQSGEGLGRPGAVFEPGGISEWVAYFEYLTPGRARYLLDGLRAASLPNVTVPIGAVVRGVWQYGTERAREILAANAVLGPGNRRAGTDGRLPVERAVRASEPAVRSALAGNENWQYLWEHTTGKDAASVYRAAYALLSDADPRVRREARRRHLDWLGRIRVTPVSTAVQTEASSRATGADGLWPDPLVDSDWVIRGDSPYWLGELLTEQGWLRLFVDSDPRVRARAIRQCVNRPDLAERLVDDPDPLVRAALPGLPGISVDVLLRLEDDSSAKVRAVVAAADGLPTESLARLTEDRVKSVRDAAARRFLRALAGTG